MFKIRLSIISCAIAIGSAASGVAWAKDEPKKGEPAHKPQPSKGTAPAQPNHGRTPPPGKPSGQSAGQSLPQFKVNQGGGQSKAQDNQRQQNAAKVHIPQGNPPQGGGQPGKQPQLNVPQGQPNNQVQQNGRKTHVPHGNPGSGGAQPGSQPKLNVPQGQSNNQTQQNGRKILAPQGDPGSGGAQPGSQPKLNVPQGQSNNQAQQNGRKTHVPQGDPGSGGAQPGSQPKLNVPQGQPNVRVPHGDSKKDLPANIVPGSGAQPAGPSRGLPGSDAAKAHQINPNAPGTLNSTIGTPADPKLNLGHRGAAGGAQKAPSNVIPGLGNDPKVGNRSPQSGREHLPLRIEQPIAGVQKHTVPLNIPKNGRGIPLTTGDKVPGKGPGKSPDQFQSLLQARDHRELRQNLDHLKQSPDFGKHAQPGHVNLDRISGLHQDRLQSGEGFQHWRQANVGRELNLDRQFQLQRHGDLTRRMNLSVNVINAGGWQHRQHGVVAAAFTTGAVSVWYAGGGCYPAHCWYPKWSPWVSWCWWDTCTPFYDPRPNYCRPIVYQPCLPWVYYQYPVWQPLPVVTCGTWVDVSPVVIPVGLDLQLLAVRFVDNGHAEQNLGPRYRVWVRNNSPVQITAPFSVLALADNDQVPNAVSPQAGAVIPSMDIGEIKPVDIRLPLAANRSGVTPEGYRVPFAYLHVLVDSHQQIAETDEANNGSVVARTDILPVDPAAFSTDQTAAAPGGTLTVAGEGFGPEPGRVLVSVNGQQTEAIIQGWYDLGIRFTVPSYTLTGVVEADVLVVRGDGAAANPLDIQLAPQAMLGQSVDIPGAPIPDAPQ